MKKRTNVKIKINTQTFWAVGPWSKNITVIGKFQQFIFEGPSPQKSVARNNFYFHETLRISLTLSTSMLPWNFINFSSLTYPKWPNFIH